MKFRLTLLTLVFLGASSLALAQTKAEDDACRPDVRRFCYKVPAGAGNDEFLKCLELNRDRLSKKCLAVLMDHGR